MSGGLPREARLDCGDYVAAAATDVRAVIELCAQCGPVLVAAYRALAAVSELAEALDRVPEIRPEEAPQ